MKKTIFEGKRLPKKKKKCWKYVMTYLYAKAGIRGRFKISCAPLRSMIIKVDKKTIYRFNKAKFRQLLTKTNNYKL